MGRKRRYRVYRLAKERKEAAALKSIQEAVKASTSDFKVEAMVEPTPEPKIVLKAEIEAPVEIKKTEAAKPKKTTRRRTTTTKTVAKTPRRRSTKKKVEETTNGTNDQP